jgi:PAS domain S-box-containing protein
MKALSQALDGSIFHAYLQHSLAPAWISDEDGHMFFINDLARAIWRLDEDYQSKHVYELFPKEIGEHFLESDKVVLESGQPLTFVAPSIRIDGSPGFYMVHKFLLPHSAARRLVAGQAIDITEQVHAREELERSNERFFYVSKATSDCIWDWDLETGEIYRSDSLLSLSGYTRDEIRNNQSWWYEKTHPDDRDRIMDKIAHCIQEGRNYCNAEYRFLSADGSYKNFCDNGYIIYRDGKAVRAIGAVRDITERRRLQAQLLQQKVEQQKEIARAMISARDEACNELAKELHDNVNQILFTVNLLLGYLKDTNFPDSENCLGKSRDYLQNAIEEIRRISKSLSSYPIQQAGLIPQVKEIIGNLQMHLPIRIQFECDPLLEHQLTVEQKLMIYRIIQEQTTNIQKYARAGEIGIAVRRSSGLLHLEIRDNGRGFDPQEARKGIGFANMRDRVEAFNGTLNIAASPGKGCCVQVSFPLQREVG